MSTLEVARYLEPFPPFTHDRRRKSARRRALIRDGFACARCRKRGDLTIHHRRPRAEGGTDDPNNLETLCVECHAEEHGMGLPQS